MKTYFTQLEIAAGLLSSRDYAAIWIPTLEITIGICYDRFLKPKKGFFKEVWVEHRVDIHRDLLKELDRKDKNYKLQELKEISIRSNKLINIIILAEWMRRNKSDNPYKGMTIKTNIKEVNQETTIEILGADRINLTKKLW